MKAPTGRSLHIGLNRIDPGHYGVDGALAGCEFDAKDMQAIAHGRGFQTKLLITERATAEAVIAEIADAAKALQPGDIFAITYSGHGAQVPDTNGDEGDELDETWALYDRMLVDDELHALWGKFAQAVRIEVFSDSCHSGSVTRALVFPPVAPPPGARYKMLPRAAAERTYQTHRALYDGIQAANPQGQRAAVGASVILISGCQDNQESLDGDRNGLFTQNLKQVWADGKFQRGHRAFQLAIGEQMPRTQTPAYFVVGLKNQLFEDQTPFTI